MITIRLIRPLPPRPFPLRRPPRPHSAASVAPVQRSPQTLRGLRTARPPACPPPGTARAAPDDRPPRLPARPPNGAASRALVGNVAGLGCRRVALRRLRVQHGPRSDERAVPALANG